MALHILKLCVGVDTVEDLEAWIAHIRAERARDGHEHHFHTTRMVPQRKTEVLEGGSIYWVIKGTVQCRQRLIGIEPFTDGQGIGRCRLMLDPQVVRTHWQPRRPFQGWRYLKPDDAPDDVGGSNVLAEMPPKLRLELAELGLL
jgi:hypothetical protein